MVNTNIVTTSNRTQVIIRNFRRNEDLIVLWGKYVIHKTHHIRHHSPTLRKSIFSDILRLALLAFRLSIPKSAKDTIQANRR